MTEQMQAAAELLKSASDGVVKRLAARMWMAEVIRFVEKAGKPYSPGLELLSALEELDNGQILPILRLPEGVSPGRKPSPETSVNGMALAYVDALMQTGLPARAALGIVADELCQEVGALMNLRKKMSVQRSKPVDRRGTHKTLIEFYEREMEDLKKQICESVGETFSDKHWPSHDDPSSMRNLIMFRLCQLSVTLNRE